MPLLSCAHGARINGMIDFTSGWLVANIGHDNPKVLRAISNARGWAVIDGYVNPARLVAEEALRNILPAHLTRISLYNSGSEAIDAAVRMVKRPVYVDDRAYHGSTAAVRKLKQWSFTALPIQDPAAVLLESYLGPWCEWYSPSFIAHLRGQQQRGEARIMFDEMQAGFGRTGTWWGFDHYDIEPDVVIGGKAAAGGLPFAFVAQRESPAPEETYESTFSGNALSCAACTATIGVIRRHGLVERAAALETVVREYFPDAQGHGLALAFPEPDAERIVKRAAALGLLLLNTRRQTIKICPPLVIKRRDLIKGCEILTQLLRKD